MLAEELYVLDADSRLWHAARPFLEAALRLEQHDESYTWYGWDKDQIATFLAGLPTHCSLVVGVWETDLDEREELVIGCVCEVVHAEIGTIRTFEALIDKDLPPLEELEPGFEHALKIMQVVKAQVAPVAWALFTDKTTWNQWVLGEGNTGKVVDKSELLASFVRQGCCVLLGSQAKHHHA